MCPSLVLGLHLLPISLVYETETEGFEYLIGLQLCNHYNYFLDLVFTRINSEITRDGVL